MSDSTRPLATLKLEVARYVMYPSDPEVLDMAQSGIVDGANWLNSRRWNNLMNSEDLTTLQAPTQTDEYTLPDAFDAPHAMELLNTSGRPKAKLPFLPWDRFVYEIRNRENVGTPECYTVRNPHFDNLLTLSRIPDSSFVATYPTMRIHYYQRVLVPTDGAESMDVPSEFERYILWNAKAYVASIMAPTKVGVAQAQANEAKQLLIAKDMHVDTDLDVIGVNA